MTTDKAMVTDAISDETIRQIADSKDVATCRARINAALSAVLTLERGEAEPVAVKPLEWKESNLTAGNEGGYERDAHADSVLGRYNVYSFRTVGKNAKLVNGWT